MPDPIGHASAAALGRALGMSQGWCHDPGRLEDAIHGTLSRSNTVGREPNFSFAFAGDLDCSVPCSHGLSGIFGHRFATALEASGKLITLIASGKIDSEGRISLESWRLTFL